MEIPQEWQPITIKDLDQFRSDVANDMPKIELARTFLTITDGAPKANLKPEILLLCGEQLSDPKTLLTGPNLLIWQNQRRPKGDVF